MLQRVTHSAAETEAFAAELAKKLHAGDVIAFRGGMGAGKTAFTRGLATGLGVTGEVASPTFALVHEYAGNPPLIHFDLYRVSDPDDLYTTGFYDYLDGSAILAVEWSERLEDFLPENAITVTLRILGEQEREITVTGGDRF